MLVVSDAGLCARAEGATEHTKAVFLCLGSALASNVVKRVRACLNYTLIDFGLSPFGRPMTFGLSPFELFQTTRISGLSPFGLL